MSVNVTLKVAAFREVECRGETGAGEDYQPAVKDGDSFKTFVCSLLRPTFDFLFCLINAMGVAGKNEHVGDCLNAPQPICITAPRFQLQEEKSDIWCSKFLLALYSSVSPSLL